MSIRDAIGLPGAGDGLPPDAPRGKAAQAILSGELLAQFQHFVQTQTQATARLAGRIVNDVLEVGSAKLDGNGTLTLQFHVAVGAIFIDNTAGHDVIVVAGGLNTSATAPPPGVGVYRVRTLTARPVNIAGRQVTIYGTAGDEISYQAYTAGVIVGAQLTGVGV